MLGLGDIVIPGLFIALMLRWDVVQCAEKGQQLSEGKKMYFYAQMLGYVLVCSPLVSLCTCACVRMCVRVCMCISCMYMCM